MLFACSETSGTPIHFQMDIGTETENDEPVSTYTNDVGWEVRLEAASIAVGSVYLRTEGHDEHDTEGGPVGVDDFDASAPEAGVATLGHTGTRIPRRVAPGSWWTRISGWLIPVAHAHGADEDSTDVRGEWVGQTVVNALDTQALSLTGLRGLQGEVRSVSVRLDPPSPDLGRAAEALHGYHAYVVGSAQREGDTIPFEGGLRIEAALRSVDGIELELALDDGVHVELDVRVRSWFAAADFGELPNQGELNEDGRYAITPATEVYRAWLSGVRQPTAFTASVQ